MTRKEIARKAFDQHHKELMLKVRHARGVARVRALNELKNFVTERLRGEK